MVRADQWDQNWPVSWFAGNIDPLVGKIRNSRPELKPEHVAEREDLVGEPGGVLIVRSVAMQLNDHRSTALLSPSH